jgi:hypothetical protein
MNFRYPLFPKEGGARDVFFDALRNLTPVMRCPDLVSSTDPQGSMWRAFPVCLLSATAVVKVMSGFRVALDELSLSSLPEGRRRP